MMNLPTVEAPKYKLTMPSTQKVYDFRPWLVSEEKIMMIAHESGDSNNILTAIQDVIKACTFDKINVDELTMYDLEACFIAIRGKAVGEIATVNMKCTECGVDNEVDIDSDQVVIKNLEKFIDVKDRTFHLNDTLGVVVKHPSVNDVVNIGVKDMNDPAEAMKLLAASIESIFSDEEVWAAEDQSVEDIVEFLEQFSKKQLDVLKPFFDVMPTSQVDVSFTCKDCKADNTKTIIGMNNFF